MHEIKIKMTDPQKKWHDWVVAEKVCAETDSWVRVIDEEVSGSISMVGFSQDNKYLICLLSTAEKYICDTRTGECVIDESEKVLSFNEEDLSISVNHNLVTESKVKMTGIYGYNANIRFITSDGWKVMDFCFPNTSHHILLLPPNLRPGDYFSGKIKKVAKTITTLIAYGFSSDGQFLFVVERDNIVLYSRR